MLSKFRMRRLGAKKKMTNNKYIMAGQFNKMTYLTDHLRPAQKIASNHVKFELLNSFVN